MKNILTLLALLWMTLSGVVNADSCSDDDNTESSSSSSGQ